MTWLLSLVNLNRVKYWIVVAFVALAAIGLMIAKIKADGKKAAKYEQLEATLKRKQMEAKVEADLSSISAADRRKRLRERWSKQ